MRSIKSSLSFICAALCCVFLVGSIIAAVLLRPSTRSSDTPSAFSLEPVPHRQAMATPPMEEPKAKPPECSLSEREDDEAAFITRAKEWTPECRMRALKEACTPHCLFGDAHVGLVEAAKDKAEERLLLDLVVANNTAELKHARALFVEMQKFVAYAATVVPHSFTSPLGRECHGRMKRDFAKLDDLQKRSEHAQTFIGSTIYLARMCANCSEEPSRLRECERMNKSLSEGDRDLRKAERDLADLRKTAAARMN